MRIDVRAHVGNSRPATGASSVPTQAAMNRAKSPARRGCSRYVVTTSAAGRRPFPLVGMGARMRSLADAKPTKRPTRPSSPTPAGAWHPDGLLSRKQQSMARPSELDPRRGPKTHAQARAPVQPCGRNPLLVQPQGEDPTLLPPNGPDIGFPESVRLSIRGFRRQVPS